MGLLVLDKAAVETIESGLETTDVLDTITDALCLFSSPPTPTSIEVPHRLALSLSSHKSLIMPSRAVLPESPPLSTIKIVSVPHSGSAADGLPATVLAMDETTGLVRAIINGGSLTALRTAAASAIATRLSLEKSDTEWGLAIDMSIIGAGLQAYYHALLLSHTIRRIKVIHIYNRSLPRLQSLVTLLRQRLEDVYIEGHLLEELKKKPRMLDGSRIICTCTPSLDPILTPGILDLSFRSKPLHINLIGSYTPQMKEIHPSLLPPRILVDTREGCQKEFGEWLSLSEDARPELVEVGEWINGLPDEDGADGGGGGEGEGTWGKGDRVTVFKSVGMGALDTAIAGLVLEEAERRAVGREVPF
ncbi:NAD(P)-binding protein [Atractiella rhizophila]|nr:NAD(P)-binding protein [Atractiella rhizophila]